MSLSVRCLLCIDKELARLQKLAEQEKWSEEKLSEKREKAVELAAYDIRSKIIAKSTEEEMQLLGQELLMHVMNSHEDEAKKLAILSMQANGFQLLKFFETKDSESLFETEKEKMRTMILEETMRYDCSDEDEDEELDEELEDLESEEDDEDNDDIEEEDELEEEEDEDEELEDEDDD